MKNGLAFLKHNSTGKTIDRKLQLLENPVDLNDFSFHTVFDEANWQVDPQESLVSLCDKRAWQIRNSYDYIILYFSGGSDSITMLNAFIRNRIDIDEIVVYVNSDTNDLSLNGVLALKKLKELNLNAKITAVDINAELLDKIIKDKTWRTYQSFSGLLHSFYRFRIDFYEQNYYIKSRPRKGSIGHVFGGMFPKISIESNKVYSVVNLKQFMISSLDPDNVQFFTDASMIELHIKQCYDLAKFLVKSNGVESQETEEYKLTIRDEYDSKISPTKNNGDTKTSHEESNSKSQHYKLSYDCDYEKKLEYRFHVIKHFKAFKDIALESFNKKYYMFDV